MDHRLQTLARAVRADPGNLELARRCRAELRRARATSEAQALLDDLSGTVATVEAWSLDLGDKARGRPRWRQVTPSHRPPLLRPHPLPAAPLRVAWRAPGLTLWRSSGLVILERSDHSLEARCLHTGAVRWSVASIQPPLGALSEDERAVVLPWVVGPWGAVEVVVSYEAPLVYRRVGRYHAKLGRVTDRTPVDRGHVEVDVRLGAVIPEGGTWSAAPPEQVREDLAPELAHAGLTIDDWDQEPIRISLDTTSRSFGISSEEPEQWAILRLTGGGDLPTSCAAAGWTPEEHPFPENVAVPPYRAEANPAPRPLDPTLLGPHLDGRALVPWGEPWAFPDGATQACLLPGEGPLTLQLGQDELLVLTPAAA